MKRYMALDIGDATIGIAVSDLLGLTAQGVETIRRTELSADLDRLAVLVQEYDAAAFVAGLPKHMNGDEGTRCTIVRSFMAEAAERFPTMKIYYWDERLSTVAASRALLEGDVSRKNAARSSTRWQRSTYYRGFWIGSSI